MMGMMIAIADQLHRTSLTKLVESQGHGQLTRLSDSGVAELCAADEGERDG